MDQLNQIGTTKLLLTNISNTKHLYFRKGAIIPSNCNTKELSQISKVWLQEPTGQCPTRQQHVILWLAMPGQKLGQKHRPRWFDPVNTRHNVIGHSQYTVCITSTNRALWHYSYGFSGKTQVKKLDLCWCDVNHSLRKNIRSEKLQLSN